jgi:hypothetical protein
MFDTHDARIARWNQTPGPRVGDWCETKNRGWHRIGAVRGVNIRLAGPTGRFALGADGVTYSGLLLDHSALPISSLVRQPGSKPGPIDQPHYFTPECRVFKER